MQTKLFSNYNFPRRLWAPESGSVPTCTCGCPRTPRAQGRSIPHLCGRGGSSLSEPWAVPVDQAVPCATAGHLLLGGSARNLQAAATPDAGREEQGGLAEAMPADICSVLTHLRTLSLQRRSWSSGHMAKVLQTPTLHAGPPQISKQLLFSRGNRLAPRKAATWA